MIAPAKIEISYQYSPNLSYLTGDIITVFREPEINTVRESFQLLAPHETKLRELIKSNEPATDPSYFTINSLLKRKPDHLILNSWDYTSVINYQGKDIGFINIKKYFDNLLSDKTPYKVVFDENSQPNNK